MNLPAHTNIRFVSDAAELTALCQHWQQCPVLALDTEFIRTNTFYPIPALLQVYDGRDCSLVDLKTLGDSRPLSALLTNPSVTKVLHSCSEDLEVFDRLLQVLPAPLFDTQVAAAFLGYGFSIGYSRLVKSLYDTELPKDESRSDWLQRPLTPAQVEYAALDVIYLYRIHEHFVRQLQHSDKLAWVEACNRELIGHYHHNQQPQHYFQRIRNAWRLDDDAQHLLYQLCCWREHQARSRNKPRNHIVRDDCLFDIARQQPKDKAALAAIKSMTPQVMKHHGNDLLTLLTNSAGVPDQHFIAHEQPLPREAGKLVDQLREAVEQVSQQLDVAPEMLARKKDIHEYCAAVIQGDIATLPASLDGWRKPVIGTTFLDIGRQFRGQ